MHKIAQKVTSVALAASMLLSMFAVNTVAFADEFKDNTTVSDEVTEAPVSDDEVDAVESVDKTDTSNSESEDTPVESPEPSQTVTDVVDLTHDSTADTVKDDTANSEDVVYTESDTSEDVIATPETAEPFIGIQAVTPDYGDKISAEVGDTVTLDALLNRDDVSVTYQWQKKQAFAADESYAIYPYEADEPTRYNFIIEDTTETAVLADKPDYVWQGCEMYYAVVDALDEIGADSSDVQIAYHTPNFVLDGYTITAANAEDGTVEVYASNGESTYTAHLNDDGKWEFSDEAAASQDTDWLNIDGATEPSYTFEVAEDDLTASYRCLITVTDEAYKEANFKALEELGNELTDEDKAGDIILSTVQFKVVSTDIATAETANGDNAPATFAMLARSFAPRAGGNGPALSSDNQWITGLNGNYEYITKNMYDQVTEWFNAGKFDKATADRYWTQIGGAWSGSKVGTANVLDDNGFPTGATRQYMEFPLTDGNMLEVNSEWYGQTVYFRPHNSNNAWTVTGTAVEVPAYTAVIRDADKNNYGTGASGTKYKDAVVFLNPWISDAGRVYANYINYITDNGWLCNNDGSHMNQHITVLSVAAEQFNANPEMYMMDAEGNYRIDSIGWGVCVQQ